MSAPRHSPEALRRLLNPRSVAIIGASATPGALGAAVLANLDRMGFSGDIHLVNPNRDRIGDRPCLKSADALPEGVDAAVLAIPRPAVLDTLRALVRRKVGAAVIFSAGFAEGGAEGAREQQEIARLAAESGLVVEGPNCLGLVNYSDRVALTFIDVRESARDGGAGVGLVSQSGAMAAVLGTMLAARAANVTCSISTGNEAASGAEDYLEHLLGDARTRVVGVIAEQFRQPRRFLALARRARAAGKFIVLLHPGRSGAARASAATHTGAMAGDYAVMRTLVEHHGVLLADGLEEFADLLELMARCPVPPAGGAAVLTESGAFKALALDLCEQAGLPLPELDAVRVPALRAALPPFVPVSNPVDLTAQALVDPDLYRKALTTLLADERFGCVVVTIIQADATAQKFSSVIGALRQLRPAKPVVFAALDEGAIVPPEHIAELRTLGVPYFPSPERALRAVAKVSAWSSRVQPAQPVATPTSLATLLPIGVVPEYRAKQLLAPLGIPFPEGRFVTTLEQAQTAAAALGFPVALKAQAVALSHKSDAGGVVLGLRDADQLADGWRRLHDNLARSRLGLALDGVLLEKMAPRGLELIVGGRNDPDWGPVLLVGLGGVQAEAMRDVRLLPPDLDEAGIARELRRLRGAALLGGFRGTPPVDVAAVAALIARVGRLLLAEPTLRELDLNPVIALPEGQGAIALDALMVFAE